MGHDVDNSLLKLSIKMFNSRALGTFSTPSTDLVPFSHLLHIPGKIPMYEIHAELISLRVNRVFSWYVVDVNSTSCESHVKMSEIHEKTTFHVKCEIRTKFTWKFSSQFHFYRFYLPCYVHQPKNTVDLFAKQYHYHIIILNIVLFRDQYKLKPSF